MVNGRMTAVEGCRVIAQEIWRVERQPELFFVHGLSSERAVRDRLQKTAMELEQENDLPPALALKVKAIHFGSDDPLSILERTEAIISAYRPGTFSGAAGLIQGSGKAELRVLRLLIVQSIGGRLGRWAVRSLEIPDARTARALYKDLGQSTWSQYRALLETSEELIAEERFREAAASLFDADRLVRTSAGLLRAATALTRCGDYISALWAVRACLLEPRSGFESGAAIERALELERRLRAVIEGRAAIPLSADESQLLLTREPRLELTKPKPTAELIQRPRLPPFPQPLPRKPVAPLAYKKPPPLPTARPPTALPSLRAPAQPPPLALSQPPPRALSQPPPRALSHPPPRALSQPPPLAPRRSTLPPSKKHVVLLETERAEAPFFTERVRAVEVAPEQPTIVVAANVPTAVLPRARSQRTHVAELIELDENIVELDGEDIPVIEADRSSEEWDVVELGGEDIPLIKAEPISEEWVIEPALEDLPTDTSMPLPPEVFPQPSVREITERIRFRVF